MSLNRQSNHKSYIHPSGHFKAFPEQVSKGESLRNGLLYNPVHCIIVSQEDGADMKSPHATIFIMTRDKYM